MSAYPTGAGDLQFVFPEQGKGTVSWSKKLQHETAICWLAGGSLGGLYGAVEGIRQAPGSGVKLLVNSGLNGLTRRGLKSANALGAVSLLYNLAEAGLNYAHEDTTGYGVHTIAAGVATGLLYKSTAGLRRMGIFAAAGGVIAAGLVAAKQMEEQGYTLWW